MSCVTAESPANLPPCSVLAQLRYTVVCTMFQHFRGGRLYSNWMALNNISETRQALDAFTRSPVLLVAVAQHFGAFTIKYL